MSVPKIAIFQGKQIRRHWDNEKELWYFSVIDVIEALSGSTIPRRYWSDLKIKLQKEGSEVYEKIVQLKMIAPDGKSRITDCTDTEAMLRIVQSIPSPNAIPFQSLASTMFKNPVKRAFLPKSARISRCVLQNVKPVKARMLLRKD